MQREAQQHGFLSELSERAVEGKKSAFGTLVQRQQRKECCAYVFVSLKMKEGRSRVSSSWSTLRLFQRIEAQNFGDRQLRSKSLI